MSGDCKDQILVFDVGGSHISGGLFRPETLSVDGLYTLPVRETGSAEQFFSTFESLRRMILPTLAANSRVSVAIPNPFDYECGISYMQHKYRELYGKNLRDGLAQHLGCEPARIHFLNDAAAFLIGEIYHGAATRTGRAIGITLGTGVGSAFAVDGKIVVTAHGVPAGGEIWNLPYRDGTVEDFVSTRAIQGRYEQLTGKWAEVLEIADLGIEHSPTRQTFEDFGKELGNVLREVCLEFAPQHIVLGGGVSRSAQIFLHSAEKELNHPAIQIRVSTLFERAPLIGAGVSWKENNRLGKIQTPELGEKN